MNADLLAVLEFWEREKGINRDTLLAAVQESLLAAAKKAVGAVAASILTAAYHMIANGTFYQDLGADHFERRTKPTQIKRLVAKLQSLGYEVEIKPLAA